MTPAGTKQSAGCLTVLFIVVVVFSLFASGSLNPLAVYSSQSLLAKVVVSVVGTMFFVGVIAMLMMLLQWWMLGLVIQKTTGQRAQDVRCPGCGNPLLKFVSAYGPPRCCPNPNCKRWWHNGPNCYQKGDNRGLLAVCPHCVAEQRPNEFEQMSSNL